MGDIYNRHTGNDENKQTLFLIGFTCLSRCDLKKLYVSVRYLQLQLCLTNRTCAVVCIPVPYTVVDPDPVGSVSFQTFLI
jgi:hypothetical protein